MKVDVAVIGAGALGLSTALHCALLGRSVAVVDRAAAGSQASGRAAGLFKSVQADEPRTWLARRSIEKAARFEEWAGVPLETQRSGSFLIARTPEHRAFLQAELAQSRGWGVELREATAAELAERACYYHPGGSELAVWCPEDLYIDEPLDLVRAYVSACQLHGVQILESEAVVEVLVPGGRVGGLETGARRIEAGTIVDAAGAWVRQVGDLAGAQIAVAPVRHQLLITEPSSEIRGTDPIIRVIDAASYLRPARGGLMFGAFEADPLPIDPRQQPPSFTTDDVPLDLGHLHKIADQVSAEIPLAGQAPVADHRGGLFTMSPDGRFLIGPVQDVPGLWVASGCNGSGFSSSPAIGEVLATWIIDGNPPAGDFASFSPARFGALTDQALIEKGTWQYAHYYDPAPTLLVRSYWAGVVSLVRRPSRGKPVTAPIAPYWAYSNGCPLSMVCPHATRYALHVADSPGTGVGWHLSGNPARKQPPPQSGRVQTSRRVKDQLRPIRQGSSGARHS